MEKQGGFTSKKKNNSLFLVRAHFLGKNPLLCPAFGQN